MKLSDLGVEEFASYVVSVSALSDRGVKRSKTIQPSVSQPGFSIRSFGSWGEAELLSIIKNSQDRVSVSALSDRGVKPKK